MDGNTISMTEINLALPMEKTDAALKERRNSSLDEGIDRSSSSGDSKNTDSDRSHSHSSDSDHEFMAVKKPSGLRACAKPYIAKAPLSPTKPFSDEPVLKNLQQIRDLRITYPNKPELNLPKETNYEYVKRNLNTMYQPSNEEELVTDLKNRIEALLTENFEAFDDGDKTAIARSLHCTKTSLIPSNDYSKWQDPVRICDGLNAFLSYYFRNFITKVPTHCWDTAHWLSEKISKRTLSSDTKAMGIDFYNFFIEINKTRVLEAVKFYMKKEKTSENKQNAVLEALHIWLDNDSILIDDVCYSKKDKSKGIPIGYKTSSYLVIMTLGYVEELLLAKLNQFEAKTFSGSFTRYLLTGWLVWPTNDKNHRPIQALKKLWASILGFSPCFNFEQKINKSYSKLSFLDVGIVIKNTAKLRYLSLNVNEESTREFFEWQYSTSNYPGKQFLIGSIAGMSSLTFHYCHKSNRQQATKEIKEYFAAKGYSHDMIKSGMSKGKALKFGPTYSNTRKDILKRLARTNQL